MSFYEMAIIDTCENYRNFSHVPIQDFSVAENLIVIKHCGLYNKNNYSVLKTDQVQGQEGRYCTYTPLIDCTPVHCTAKYFMNIFLLVIVIGLSGAQFISNWSRVMCKEDLKLQN